MILQDISLSECKSNKNLQLGTCEPSKKKGAAREKKGGDPQPARWRPSDPKDATLFFPRSHKMVPGTCRSGRKPLNLPYQKR